MPLGSVKPMFEEALMRVLTESDPIPAGVVEHAVTGRWPTPELRCDIAFPHPG
jgi:hypothetical protein